MEDKKGEEKASVHKEKGKREVVSVWLVVREKVREVVAVW